MRHEHMPMMADLTWQTKKPTEPGFYLWRVSSEGQVDIVELKEPDVKDPNYWPVRTGRGSQLLGFMGGEWAGPVPIPA